MSHHVVSLERLANQALAEWRGETAQVLRSAAARIEELQTLVNSLDIQCMHPSMDGRHQCSIRANGRALSVEQWDLIMDCRESGAS
jgi:hypothetical protein